MVKSRCELITKYLLPALRALIAAKLVSKYNLTQIEAAKKMGTTQAAISYYLNSKRGAKAIALLEKDAEIMKDIERIVELMNKGSTNIQLGDVLCKLCKRINEKGLLNQI